MRWVDIILVVALVAVVLIVTFAFTRKAVEPFDGYQVYGGSGSWPGSPQCSDKAIGFQEDTQTPGRYWGWENNQTCAFYTIPKSEKPAAPVSQEDESTTALFEAAKSGDLALVKDMIENKGIPATTSKPDGWSVLHEAAWSGKLEVVKYLIEEKGVPATTARPDGHTVLHAAAWSGNIDLVKYLIEIKGIPATTTQPDGYSVLHNAASGGQLGVVKYLIDEKKVPATTKRNDGYSVLHTAAWAGKLEIVKYLIEEKGLPANTAQPDGFSVLHSAAWNGQLEVVKYLIDKKGVPATTTRLDGTSVLHLAVWAGMLDVVKYLIETRGIPATTARPDGWSILYEAAFRSHLNVVQYLVDTRGVQVADPVTTEKRDGNSVLHIAASGYEGEDESTRLKLVKYLVEIKGLRDLVNKPNKNNKKPIDFARDAKYQTIVDYLQTVSGKEVGMYKQCGGKGGMCSSDGQCADNPWEGTRCPTGASCTRVNEWHWQCDTVGNP